MRVTEPRRVVLLDFPVAVAVRAFRQRESLLRELAIIALGGGDDTGIPARLVELAQAFEARYVDLNPGVRDMIDDAATTGRDRIDLEVRVPSGVREDALAIGSVLAEALEYCRTADLLTPPPSDEIVAFRAWFLGEIARQVEGEPPLPWREVPAHR